MAFEASFLASMGRLAGSLNMAHPSNNFTIDKPFVQLEKLILRGHPTIQVYITHQTFRGESRGCCLDGPKKSKTATHTRRTQPFLEA